MAFVCHQNCISFSKLFPSSGTLLHTPFCESLSIWWEFPKVLLLHQRNVVPLAGSKMYSPQRQERLDEIASNPSSSFLSVTGNETLGSPVREEDGFQETCLVSYKDLMDF